MYLPVKDSFALPDRPFHRFGASWTTWNSLISGSSGSKIVKGPVGYVLCSPIRLTDWLQGPWGKLYRHFKAIFVWKNHLVFVLHKIRLSPDFETQYFFCQMSGRAVSSILIWNICLCVEFHGNQTFNVKQLDFQGYAISDWSFDNFKASRLGDRRVFL